jgi:hypothetical protein
MFIFKGAPGIFLHTAKLEAKIRGAIAFFSLFHEQGDRTPPTPVKTFAMSAMGQGYYCNHYF